jgi:stage VI sporulation protein D
MRGGIILSNENESYLRFSLEESIWFQKGQEVAELYSLSLEPNVTIQERDQYVVIQGTLDLIGEYKEERRSGESEIKDYTQSFLPKNIQHVERRDDGINMFTHRFPVDITIPYNRINSIADVDVAIQTFDYALPEKNCLKLQADLVITGIYKEQPVSFEQDEELSDQLELEDDSSERENEQQDYWFENPPHRYEYEEQLGANEQTWVPPGFEAVYDVEEPEEVEVQEQYEEVPVRQEFVEDQVLTVADECGQDEELQQEQRIETEEYLAERVDEEESSHRTEIYVDKTYLEQETSKETNELNAPFYAEAKKVPEEGRYEEQEDFLANPRPNIPVFEVPVAPLFDEIKKGSAYAEPKSDVEMAVFDKVKQPTVDKEQQANADQHVQTTDPLQASQGLEAQQTEDSIQQPEAIQLTEDLQAANQQHTQDNIQQPEPEEQQAAQQKGFIKNKYATILDLLPKGNRSKQEEQSSDGRDQDADKDAVKQPTLMDYFGRKQEEQLTRLKVCIVQHGDTLESLSERYDVTVQTLLNSNELDPNSDIYEGQVLYIPKVAAIKR